MQGSPLVSTWQAAVAGNLRLPKWAFITGGREAPGAEVLKAELEETVSRAARGDQEAFATVVIRFQDMAVAYAFSILGDFHLAEGAAQEAFLEAHRDLGQLREPVAFPSWLRRLVFKQCDRLTRRKRLSVVPLDAVRDVPSAAAGPPESLELLELGNDVMEVVRGLPSREREVVTLFYVSGYSHREIAEFLGVSPGSVKKRLHAARHRLLKEMLRMVKENLHENRRSRSDDFGDRVQFLAAVRSRDLGRVKALLDKAPELIDARTEWETSSEAHYWPLGASALHLAAGSGDEQLAGLLLSRAADGNAQDQSGATPLHVATLAGQATIVSILLRHAADFNAATRLGHTPLHHAAMRGYRRIAEQLVEAGAVLNAEDKRGFTPVDWAAMKGHAGPVELLVAGGARKPSVPIAEPEARPEMQREARLVPVAEGALGRLLDAEGEPIDNGPSLADAPRRPIYCPAAGPEARLLRTGIKVIDLLAPLTRGGHIGVLTPMAGVGRKVVVAQIMTSVAALHGGFVVYLGLEVGSHTARRQVLEWRGDMGMDVSLLDERMVCVFGRRDDPEASWVRLAETGLTIAEDLRRKGRDVMLVVEGELTSSASVVGYLRANTGSTPEAAITMVFDGEQTAGLEPPHLVGLNAVVTFDRDRAGQGLWPAVDPLRSRSKVTTSEMVGEEHADLAAQVRRTLLRYGELHHSVDNRGMDGLFYLGDRDVDKTTVTRGRRLHRFLTQPFPGLEPFTGMPGENVALEDTVRGCRAILDGEHDALPEEAFYMVGTIQQALAKPKRSRRAGPATSAVIG